MVRLQRTSMCGRDAMHPRTRWASSSGLMAISGGRKPRAQWPDRTLRPFPRQTRAGAGLLNPFRSRIYFYPPLAHVQSSDRHRHPAVRLSSASFLSKRTTSTLRSPSVRATQQPCKPPSKTPTRMETVILPGCGFPDTFGLALACGQQREDVWSLCHRPR